MRGRGEGFSENKTSELSYQCRERVKNCTALETTRLENAKSQQNAFDASEKQKDDW